MKAISRTKLAQLFVAFLDRYPLAAVSSVFAKLLRQLGHSQEIGYFLADVARQLQLQRSHLTAQLTSAHPLSASTLKEIKKFLAQKTGAKHIEISFQKDSQLGGGLTIQTPAFTVEGSLKHYLNQVRNY